MLEQCTSNNVDVAVIGGDMFTTRSSQTLDVLMAVKNALQKASDLGIAVYISLGNHDLLDQEATYGYPSLYDTMDGIAIINDKPAILPIDAHGDLNLIVMRYWKETTTFLDKFDELCDDLKKRGIEKGNCILYVHEGIAGGLGDFEAPGEIKADVFRGFRKVLAGHYHFVKKIKDTNIEYIGSSRQKSHGEEGPQGYTIMFSDGTYSFIENQVNTRYITFDVELDDLSNDWIEKFTRYKEDGYRVRLKLKCTESQSKSIDKEALYDAGVTKLEVVTEEAVMDSVTDEDLGKKFDATGIREEYESYCDEKNFSSKLGMKYLDMI
jgi:exonuclease SbcD